MNGIGFYCGVGVGPYIHYASAWNSWWLGIPPVSFLAEAHRWFQELLLVSFTMTCTSCQLPGVNWNQSDRNTWPVMDSRLLLKFLSGRIGLLYAVSGVRKFILDWNPAHPCLFRLFPSCTLMYVPIVHFYLFSQWAIGRVYILFYSCRKDMLQSRHPVMTCKIAACQVRGSSVCNVCVLHLHICGIMQFSIWPCCLFIGFTVCLCHTASVLDS